MRRIGGSDIAKILGVSKYGNAADVYLRIVDGVVDEWNPRMERGTMFEPVLRAHAQKVLGLVLDDVESDYFPHPVHEFAHAQIDDLGSWHGMPVTVDYKTQNRFVRGWGVPDSDEVPEQIRVQKVWELACADRELGLLIVGFGEDRPAPEVFTLSNVVTYQIQRDGPLETYCIEAAREFWERHVLPRNPPPMKPLGKKAASK